MNFANVFAAYDEETGEWTPIARIGSLTLAGIAKVRSAVEHFGFSTAAVTVICEEAYRNQNKSLITEFPEASVRVSQTQPYPYVQISVFSSIPQEKQEEQKKWDGYVKEMEMSKDIYYSLPTLP